MLLNFVLPKIRKFPGGNFELTKFLKDLILSHTYIKKLKKSLHKYTRFKLITGLSVLILGH